MAFSSISKLIKSVISASELIQHTALFPCLTLIHLQNSAMFQRIEGRSASSSFEGATLASSGIGTALPDSSLSDAHQSISRPLPYDADQRYSRLQRDGLVSRRDKPMTHFQEESQPMRRNMSSSGMEILGSGKRRNGVDSDEELKLGHSGSSEKALATKVAPGVLYVQPSGEEEDVCPTCLDGTLLHPHSYFNSLY